MKTSSLNAKRAEKYQDATLWTPLEALEYLIERIKNKEIITDFGGAFED